MILHRHSFCSYFICKGFTLLELMIAISIFSVISLLTIGGLSNALNTRTHTEESLQHLVRFQMFFSIIDREIHQISKRPVRDEYGAITPAITSDTSVGVEGLEFSHHGRFALAEQSRLQRVAYYLEDNKLIKKHWKVLDRVEDTQPVKQELLNNIEELSFAYYGHSSDGTGDWYDEWEADGPLSLRAIRVTLKTPGYNDLYRIFEVRQ